MTIEDLKEMVRDNPIEFRSGLHATLEFLSRADVPIVVFSAGIAGNL
jgi:2-hydroxy-3-keto-5-methylthiopentenyl-1-phosphate phosphatase